MFTKLDLLLAIQTRLNTVFPNPSESEKLRYNRQMVYNHPSTYSILRVDEGYVYQRILRQFITLQIPVLLTIGMTRK